MLLRHLLPAACWLAISPTLALNLDDYELVDLSHPFNEETLYWPSSPSHFEKTTLANGPTAGGWFYSAFSVCMPEHGGTHLDAPRHFSEQAATTSRSFCPPLMLLSR